MKNKKLIALLSALPADGTINVATVNNIAAGYRDKIVINEIKSVGPDEIVIFIKPKNPPNPPNPLALTDAEFYDQYQSQI